MGGGRGQVRKHIFFFFAKQHGSLEDYSCPVGCFHLMMKQIQVGLCSGTGSGHVPELLEGLLKTQIVESYPRISDPVGLG